MPLLLFMRQLPSLMLILLLAGCAAPGTSHYELGPDVQGIPLADTPTLGNPMFIPLTDPQCVSDVTAEVIDEYFKIAHQEPVHRVGDTLIEGRIETFPEVSPTLFELWRKDTATLDQRVDNTLQTYRRRAVVRMIPGENGHWIDVAVFVDLIDLPQPEHASSGAATFRYDSSLNRVENPIGGEAAPQGWVPKGRDTALEQRILSHLQFSVQELRAL